MRLINSLRFLITFMIIAVMTFFVCIINGTQAALIMLKRNGVVLTNDKKERDVR